MSLEEPFVLLDVILHLLTVGRIPLVTSHDIPHSKEDSVWDSEAMLASSVKQNSKNIEPNIAIRSDRTLRT